MIEISTTYFTNGVTDNGLGQAYLRRSATNERIVLRYPIRAPTFGLHSSDIETLQDGLGNAHTVAKENESGKRFRSDETSHEGEEVCNDEKHSD